MKTLLKLIIVGLCIWGVIHLDILLYHFIVGLIPQTEWLGFIKVVIVILMIMYTTGISIALMGIASIIALGILGLFMPKKRSPFGNNFPLKQSRFQQRLNALAEEKKKKRENL
jgi:hypothetical protein